MRARSVIPRPIWTSGNEQRPVKTLRNKFVDQKGAADLDQTDYADEQVDYFGNQNLFDYFVGKQNKFNPRGLVS